ncbi:hypothetical protein CRUP_002737 [Coryphaenoides rupestris]|nr:hypothetical protein CRUP_002737 [Coryphaenoides rupestris]
MSAKAISEQTGKEFLYKYICTAAAVQNRFCYANRLVVKPDQLIKRRGKLGLVGINLDLQGVRDWVKTRLMKETMVAEAKGVLKNFLIEPFVEHTQDEEFYVCVYAAREGDYVLFHHEGGVEAQRLLVAVDEKLSEEQVTENPPQPLLASFIVGLFNLYEDLYFTYLEINPLVVTGDGVYVLDMAAKIDATADYICKAKRPTSADGWTLRAVLALKLTLPEPPGRIWPPHGGWARGRGLADTICDLGGQTYDYAKTILSLHHAGGSTRKVGKTTGIPIHVFGTETHMTAIVGMAMGHRPIPNQPPMDAHTANFLLNSSSNAVHRQLTNVAATFKTPAKTRTASFSEPRAATEATPPKKSKAGFPAGTSPRGDHKQKFYWGHKEILLPVYKNMADAMKKHSEVGGIKPGCFKIGNTGGMLDNILASKLYRPGSVAYVSRSGGMSNELNNIISRTTDGVYEGVAIGGDRYPGSTFMDHVLRYQDTAGIQMIVVLGEIGGTDEYRICEGIGEGRITKPVVCWCIGTCATMFASEVQFGHAGACANQASETAVVKNQALRDAGAYVPKSFDELGDVIKTVYDELVANGTIVPAQEVPPPTVPMDYSWARELGLIRKPASFMTSICDERGQELIYAGMPITEVFKEEMGLGGVLGLLWFQRRLPRYACQFIEMCLMVTADHGPAVSGAHNTIVCARAGKDLISSLTSGLLTIGDRFGGALDAAAKQFSKAFDSSMLPMEFVNKMKKDGKLIMGIGHRVKSINNPDMRVQILKDFVIQHFPSTQLLDYALNVEKITTSKKPNLILNVDGFIGVAFVDLLRTCGGFTRDEADEFVEIGSLNGIFVLGRSIGFIGHYLDQKRLKQGLYRHPWDDISYVLPEHMSM